MPVVELPPKPGQREDYFLTRQQIVERVRAARRRPELRHIVRMLLIGLYTGTRPGTILKLKWQLSMDGGHFDLDAGILHRKPPQSAETNKRAPKCKIHRKLRVLLRLWKKADRAKGILHVIHYQGKPVKKLRRSWATIARTAGHEGKDGAHILRHSCATWMMQQDMPIFEAAGYLGMSPTTLEEVYGHHSPNFQDQVAGFRPAISTNKKRAVG